MSKAFVGSAGSRCASGISSAQQNGSYLDIPLYGLTFAPSEITIVRTEADSNKRFLCAFKQKTGGVTGYVAFGSYFEARSCSGSVYKAPYYGNAYIMRLDISLGNGTSVFWIAKE